MAKTTSSSNNMATHNRQAEIQHLENMSMNAVQQEDSDAQNALVTAEKKTQAASNTLTNDQNALSKVDKQLSEDQTTQEMLHTQVQDTQTYLTDQQDIAAQQQTILSTVKNFASTTPALIQDTGRHDLRLIAQQQNMIHHDKDTQGDIRTLSQQKKSKLLNEKSSISKDLHHATLHEREIREENNEFETTIEKIGQDKRPQQAFENLKTRDETTLTELQQHQKTLNDLQASLQKDPEDKAVQTQTMTLFGTSFVEDASQQNFQQSGEGIINDYLNHEDAVTQENAQYTSYQTSDQNTQEELNSQES